jgi:hypothetical protein
VKLARIRIENLFGQFDYDVTLSREDGIAILTGQDDAIGYDMAFVFRKASFRTLFRHHLFLF